MMKRLIPFALALGLSACGSTTPSTSPTTASGLTTETFNGTVAVLGSDSKNFTVAQAGEVDVTLTAVGPSPVPMGLGVGITGASGCTLLAGASTTVPPGSSVQLAGKVSPGSFCVQVSDVGNATGPVTYTVTVVHP